MTTLARWRAAQDGVGQAERKRRPFLATECDDLPQAEKWRNQVISEVARKVAQIQNAGLGEFRIRDLNDEINKLLREKGHWEARIRDLGGPDHSAGGPRLFGTDGQEVPGNRGYMYFGAAKELPGVRELFAQEPAAPPRRTRADLMRHVDADYYGYRDDDDGVLVPLEREVEREAVEKLIKDYKKKKLKEKNAIEEEATEEKVDTNATDSAGDVCDEDIKTWEMEENEGCEERAEVLRYMAHVPNIPSQQQVAEALLERKKRELLQQILGEDS